MAECRAGGGDCLIKLFGKTIPVPEAAAAAVGADKDPQQSGRSTESKGQENAIQDSTSSPPQQGVADTEDSSAEKNSSANQQQGETASKKKLKKPDKILPCPRCNSMDTKFCYYNNYNINQPRHFCKNCQRYWTAGGAMRNVPVGAGRRKGKSASHFLQRVQAALPVDPLCASAKTNGTVLSFGSDMSSLDLAEQMKHLNEKLVPITRIKNGDDQSVGSCAGGGSAEGEDSKLMSQKERVTADKSASVVQHPCMNGIAMWPFSCAPPPTCYTSGVAIPFYPAAAAFWGCMVPGAWNTPWPPHSQSESAISPSSAASASPESTRSNCFTSGKRPRDGDEERNATGNGKVWVPKTIRIDDADEVARSSILSLLGISGDKVGKDGRGCKLSSVFEQKDEAKTANHTVINSLPFLRENPAALSRSLTFQEGS